MLMMMAAVAMVVVQVSVLLLLQRRLTMSTSTTPAGDFRTAVEQEQARPGLPAEVPGALVTAT